MLGVQDHRPRQLHLGADGANPAAVQADLSGRRRAAVPGADQDDPPLDPPANREGQVQTVREGESYYYYYCYFYSLAVQFRSYYTVTVFIVDSSCYGADISCFAVCVLQSLWFCSLDYMVYSFWSFVI